MRRRIFAFVMLMLILLSGCTAQPVETTEADGIGLEEYYPLFETLRTPVRQYGESTSYLEMGNDLAARILYPACDHPTLDKAIESWVDGVLVQYQTESLGSNTDEEIGCAELTVEYDSYLIEDRLVGVKLSGTFLHPHWAHPEDLCAAFNADIQTGELLTLEGLLLPEGRERLTEKVAEDAGISEEDLDDGLLSNWLLTPQGLEITLVRGAYLPMSEGTVTLLYAYEDLNEILMLPEPEKEPPQQEEVQAPPEVQEPVPETEPSVDPDKPMIALTFDDGPSAHTARLLDIFAEHGGSGTFFVVGNMIDDRPEVLRRMAAEGHEIGGHSWDHRQLTKLSAEQLEEQLMAPRAKIYEVTGVDTTIMRPPYGSANKQVKAVAGELGIVLVNWSVDTLDWKNKNADAVYNAVMQEASDGAIILCHDLHKTTVDAMERVIPDLIAQGYQLVTVTELLSADGDAITPGTIYYKQ